MKNLSFKYFLLFVLFCFFSCEKRSTEHITTKASNQNIASQKDLEQIIYEQSVYAPVYSDIHNYSETHTLPLSAMLSVRNIDKFKKIFIQKIDYYDTKGKLIRAYLAKPIFLNPLETDCYVVDFSESKGGTGANFVVEWGNQEKTAYPIIETIMISTQNNMGISFISPSKIMAEKFLQKQEKQEFLQKSDVKKDTINTLKKP